MAEAGAEDEVVTTTAGEEDTPDLDLEAGFEGKATVETPPPPADEVDPPAAVVPEVKYRQVTEEEWQALQAKSTEIDQIKADSRKELDRVFGKVGGVERTLQALQAATPSGYNVEVTDDVVAELKKEGFPELADLTLKAFKSFAGKLKGTAPAVATLDPKAVESAVSQRLVELQLEALDDEHPDWRDTVGAKDSDNEYRKWLAKQPADYRQRLESTNSAAIISRSISKFKTDSAKPPELSAEEKAKAEKAAKEAADKAAADKAAKEAADKAATRKQRLEAAASPRGAGGHATTETEDPFEEGFRSGPAGQSLK